MKIDKVKDVLHKMAELQIEVDDLQKQVKEKQGQMMTLMKHNFPKDGDLPVWVFFKKLVDELEVSA